MPTTQIIWGRLTQADLAGVLCCQADIVHLSIPVSDIHLQYMLGRSHEWLLTKVTLVIERAVASGRKRKQLCTLVQSCAATRVHVPLHY
jgi:homocitrate synthase NifV